MKKPFFFIEEMTEGIPAPGSCLLNIPFIKRTLIKGRIGLNEKSIIFKETSGGRPPVFKRAMHFPITDQVIFNEANVRLCECEKVRFTERSICVGEPLDHHRIPPGQDLVIQSAPHPAASRLRQFFFFGCRSLPWILFSPVHDIPYAL